MTDDSDLRASILVDEIKRTFHSGLPPEMPAGYRAFSGDIRAKNYSEAIEETERFWGRAWSEVSLTDFEAFTLVFTFATDDAFPYFLGTYMLHSVLQDDYDHLAFDSLLQPPTTRWFDPRKLERQKAFLRSSRINQIRQSFSPDQRAVFLRYLELRADKGIDDPGTIEFARSFVEGRIEI